jgi:hypothetical protein
VGETGSSRRTTDSRTARGAPILDARLDASKNEEWPTAENSAEAALDGRKSPDEARQKFEAALKSAQWN